MALVINEPVLRAGLGGGGKHLEDVCIFKSYSYALKLLCDTGPVKYFSDISVFIFFAIPMRKKKKSLNSLGRKKAVIVKSLGSA